MTGWYSARVMRRLILVFMMCLLPLQWSWAAAASLCSHEAGQEWHFGHHEHQHHASPTLQCGGEEPGAAEQPGAHPDCQVCHGIGAACTATVTGMAQAWVDDGPLPLHRGYLPDPPVENLLRPPLKLVA